MANIDYSALTARNAQTGDTSVGIDSSGNPVRINTISTDLSTFLNENENVREYWYPKSSIGKIQKSNRPVITNSAPAALSTVDGFRSPATPYAGNVFSPSYNLIEVESGQNLEFGAFIVVNVSGFPSGTSSVSIFGNNVQGTHGLTMESISGSTQRTRFSVRRPGGSTLPNADDPGFSDTGTHYYWCHFLADGTNITVTISKNGSQVATNTIAGAASLEAGQGASPWLIQADQGISPIFWGSIRGNLTPAQQLDYYNRIRADNGLDPVT